MGKILEIALTAFIGAILALIGNKVLYRSNKQEDDRDNKHEERHKKIEKDIECLATKFSELDKNKVSWNDVKGEFREVELRINKKIDDSNQMLTLIVQLLQSKK